MGYPSGATIAEPGPITSPHLVPINPAAFGYCQGWVLLTREGGRCIAIGCFGQYERTEALEAWERAKRHHSD